MIYYYVWYIIMLSCIHTHVCVICIYICNICIYMITYVIIHFYYHYLKLLCLVEWEWDQHVAIQTYFTITKLGIFRNCLCQYTLVPFWNASKLLFQSSTLMPQKLTSCPSGKMKEVEQITWWQMLCIVRLRSRSESKDTNWSNRRLNLYTRWKRFSHVYVFLASSFSLFWRCHNFLLVYATWKIP